MIRLKKVGQVTPKASKEISSSRIGIGFEKLDRDAFDPEKAYDKVADIGVKWARIQSGWAKTEKQPGVYDFEWLDKIVDNLLSRGILPWICLCYGNGIYDENAAKVFGAVGVPPIFNDTQKTAWKNYVTALVNRYKGRVTHFEVWNEPDGRWCWKHGANAKELGLFTAETGSIIHAAYPQAEVIGIVQCGRNLKYLVDALTDTGAAEELDAISFHEYTADEQGIPERVAAIHAVADRFKPGIKIIQGETGSQSRTGGHGAVRELLWTERAQMKQLARHTMIDLSTDVEFTSYFSCMDMMEALNGSVGDKSTYSDFGYFGVLGADFDENGFAVGTYRKKPSYFALQTICSVFSEDYEVVSRPPVLTDEPSWFQPYRQQDYAARELTTAFFHRADGSQCYTYWYPGNILSQDTLGTVSFQIWSPSADFHLIDLCTGEVFDLTEDILEDLGSGCYSFHHLPVRDYPMALISGDFCKWG